jgi:AcrR family transcriptional regulator
MDKQQEILNAALTLFVEQGFHATPTSKIAKEAGVANGTLFHYYKTKDELIVALYVDIKTKLAMCMQEENAAPANSRATWKKYYLQALDWGLTKPMEFRFVQQFMSSPYLMLLAPEEIQKQSRFMTDMIKQGIKDKLIKPMAVELVLSLVSSHTYGISQYITSAKLNDKEKQKVMNSSFDMIWGMIAK